MSNTWRLLQFEIYGETEPRKARWIYHVESYDVSDDDMSVDEVDGASDDLNDDDDLDEMLNKIGQSSAKLLKLNLSSDRFSPDPGDDEGYKVLIVVALYPDGLCVVEKIHHRRCCLLKRRPLCLGILRSNQKLNIPALR
ncbi:hypothetical protein L2E82_45630 [Cichorium intybus]|uniref:Uncharacterized protein n=1 Tax=Cichorium intybus TaxID=13427 RepID=A0ACB8ZUH3_CICIN|nr:hypothetical protein L2E82_45630 [Cichorium intybus]